MGTTGFKDPGGAMGTKCEPELPKAVVVALRQEQRRRWRQRWSKIRELVFLLGALAGIAALWLSL